MRLAALLALLVVLLLPAGVQAHKRHRHHPQPRANPVTTAFALAQRYWHTTPCSGQITVLLQESPNPAVVEVGQQVSMSAGWQSSQGAEENVETAPQPFTHCRIWINPAVWHAKQYMAETAWPEFSIDLIHEFGHLLGLPDPQATGDIMYFEPSSDVALTGEVAPGWWTS